MSDMRTSAAATFAGDACTGTSRYTTTTAFDLMWNETATIGLSDQRNGHSDGGFVLLVWRRSIALLCTWRATMAGALLLRPTQVCGAKGLLRAATDGYWRQSDVTQRTASCSVGGRVGSGYLLSPQSRTGIGGETDDGFQ